MTQPAPEPFAALTIRQALGLAGQLKAVSDSPLLDCQLLLAHCLDKPRPFLYARDEELLSRSQQQSFASVMERRRAGEPVAYIVGRQWFWDMQLAVGPATLIPRPETETLVSAILESNTSAPRKVLDLGTGSGAIAIALARERPFWELHAVDCEESSLAVARVNADEWSKGRIMFHRSDWLSGLTGETFDIIACNPPYISRDDGHLTRLRFEPRIALVSGVDGFDAIRRVIGQARAHLVPGGSLVLEHGASQRSQVVGLLEGAGYYNIETLDDDSGVPRVVMANIRNG